MADKTLHQCFVEQFDKARESLAPIREYYIGLEMGKSMEKPTETPDVLNFFPMVKNATLAQDEKLETLLVAIEEFKSCEVGREKTPLKVIVNISEQAIAPNDQARLEAIVNKAFPYIDNAAKKYGPAAAITDPKTEFYIATTDQVANFLKSAYLDAIDERYAGQGLSTAGLRPVVEGQQLAKTDLAALTKGANDPRAVSQAVEDLKTSVTLAASTEPAASKDSTKEKALISVRGN